MAVDVLEWRRKGFGLVEVNSTLDVKEEHLTLALLTVVALLRSRPGGPPAPGIASMG